MRIYSWNVNGIRAVDKKGFLEWFLDAAADIVCVQESKATEEQVPDSLRDILGYQSHWCSGERRGYSGVGVFTRQTPLSVSRGFGLDYRFDAEGRILILEYPEFTLLNIYFPNGQKDDERLRYKLDFYDATLEYCEGLRRQGRELLICGDYNTAHNEIDLARPKANEKTSGFLRVERDWMDKWEEHGYIDSFRRLHPDMAEAYSWWSYRGGARYRNVGWRLDYHYVTPGLFEKVAAAAIHPGVMGSDHCPVSIDLNLGD